jgi:hypothetical protein
MNIRGKWDDRKENHTKNGNIQEVQSGKGAGDRENEEEMQRERNKYSDGKKTQLKKSKEGDGGCWKGARGRNIRASEGTSGGTVQNLKKIRFYVFMF